MEIRERKINQSVYDECLSKGYSQIIARVLASRVDRFDDKLINVQASNVTPAMTMADCPKAAKRIAKAIFEGQKILIFTDFDVDGCTSMAILYRAMNEVFEVPKSNLVRLTGDRIRDGYGITETIADQIIASGCNLVITADAGSSDHDRLDRLKKAGIEIIVTDHHLLPEAGVPESAYAVINPQRDDCPYDPNVAGCGVAWLLMTAVSQELKCESTAKMKLFKLLDFVALGTIADLVKINSPINRFFVKKGLEFMNALDRECWRIPLFGRTANVGTLGFQIGPRINAASRMTGRPDSAIKYLIDEDPDVVSKAYSQIDQSNTMRKTVEQNMLEIAVKQYIEGEPILIAFHESFDPGVQGIVASKLVERFGVPVIMMAKVPGSDKIAGSGRAGQFLHLRDALQKVDDVNPGMLLSFGGHKAAAGLKIKETDLDIFKKIFKSAVETQLEGQNTIPYISTDGPLKGILTIDTHEKLDQLRPFGMGFPSPSFSDTMEISEAKMVGKNPVHLSMRLNGIKAIMWNVIADRKDPIPVPTKGNVSVVYQTDINEWNGRKELQLNVKHIF